MSIQRRQESGGGDQDDRELVLAVLDGDRGAFDRLVERYQRPATALAYRLLGNMDDALEAVQESFLRAYRKLPSLQEPGRFGAWLMQIVARQSLNARRGRALRRHGPLEFGRDGERAQEPADGSADAPADVAAAGELQVRIDAAMNELTEVQRAALTLFAVEKMPQREVAELLGLTLQNVKWHVFMARKRLKTLLADML